jgi:hypothetical protein
MSDFGFRGIAGLITYFLGLGLGQRRDPAALVLVERAEEQSNQIVQRPQATCLFTDKDIPTQMSWLPGNG